MDNNNHNLFELLRQRRNEIAKANNVEPFMILHNKVLKEIAEKKPANFEELASIKGMGGKRITKYGEFILQVVNSFSANEIHETPEEKIFTVSEYLDYLIEILTPARAVIHGEVGEVKPGNGFTFFKLRDKEQEAILSCFIWNNRLSRFGIELKEGLELKIEGYPEIYKRRGTLNFEVEHIGLVGEGALKQAFELLKKKLAVAGFFALERKKMPPKYVEKIGLITSDFGDAKNDFLTHLGKFGFKIYFYDVRVEGLYAIDSIVQAIRWFNENLLDIEVLVLTRGGGSLESLQAFNSEAIAKAIFGSKIPLLTGIGHENDETIADLVADVYASTPTDAARILSDSWRNANLLLSNYRKNIPSIFRNKYDGIKEDLLSFEGNFITILSKILNFKKQELYNLQTRLTSSFQTVLEKIKFKEAIFLNNWARLRTKILTLKQSVRNQQSMFDQAEKRWLQLVKSRLFEIEQRLKMGDPNARLKQGYSIVFNLASKVVKNIEQIKIGENLNLKFYKGKAVSRVEKISP